MERFRSEKVKSFKLLKSTSTTFNINGPCSAKRSLVRSRSIQQDVQFPVGLKIQFPTLDQGIDNFFPKARTDTQIDITDLDEIKIDSQKLSLRKDTKGPKRRRPAKAMKILAHLRTDKILEYTEILPDFSSSSEYDFKKAGLASKEDFSNFALKSNIKSNLPSKCAPMLVHIKGRRHVQCRLVAPKFSSLNDGDCFVLITNDKVFSFIGKYANVIEVKACKDFCSSILREKGYNASTLVPITKENLQSYNGMAFSKILSRENEELASAGHSEEDELIEKCLNETNKVYEFIEDELVPLEDFWGQSLTTSAVSSRKVLVFDFGSEVYVWSGKNALPDEKKIAMLLAEELTNGSFNYKMCHLNPMDFSIICGSRIKKTCPLKYGQKRPEFVVLARICENMETTLFRNKFFDWPHIKIHNNNNSGAYVDCNEIQQVDGSYLYHCWNYEEPNLVLENSNLGRGNFYYDFDTRRHCEIMNVSLTKWHANSDGNQEVLTEDYCHFYSTESYTIRWVYQISITVRELSGKVSNRSTVGRDRCVYFNWQGCDASASERGTSTLHMVELDKEKGSQMIIQQFHEIPAFVRLFKIMFIHKNRKDENRFEDWRMYITHGNDQNETIAYEVSHHVKQLRSRACILLIHGLDGQLVLWKGAKTTENQQQVAQNACSNIIEKNYHEFSQCNHIMLREYCEGQETEEFFKAFGGKISNRTIYNSLIHHDESFDFTPRMYELTSKNGGFEAIEVVPGLRTENLSTAFPFVQQDLYNARQPTLFIVDAGYSIYLWQGWWPRAEEVTDQDEIDISSIENRAGENRWHLEKCEAMETTIEYWKAKCGDDEKYRNECYFVTAGYEPMEFQTIFPEWIVNESVIDINSHVRPILYLLLFFQ